MIGYFKSRFLDVVYRVFFKHISEVKDVLQTDIVRLLLENYGYDVIDLGKDVPPQKIVDTAIANQVKMVGLSALMTTTVGAMAETITLLHQQYPACKTVVGGAVLTEDYAETIGADCYAKDAKATVDYAKTVFEN